MRVRHMSRSEVLARAEDDNGYWAMVGQREEFTCSQRSLGTTLPHVSIPTITNRRVKHFITVKVTDMKATSNAGIVKMRNAMAWRTYCRVE